MTLLKYEILSDLKPNSFDMIVYKQLVLKWQVIAQLWIWLSVSPSCVDVGRRASTRPGAVSANISRDAGDGCHLLGPAKSKTPFHAQLFAQQQCFPFCRGWISNTTLLIRKENLRWWHSNVKLLTSCTKPEVWCVTTVVALPNERGKWCLKMSSHIKTKTKASSFPSSF